MTQRLDPQPIPGAPFGVMLGFDPTKPLDAQAQQQLKRLFYEKHLLLIRGGLMETADQIRIARYIAPVLMDERKRYVSNSRPDGILGERELAWHADIIFAPDPFIGLGLYALEIPQSGASTCFASAASAARTLPAPLRERVQGRKAVSVYRFELDTRGPWHSHDVLWTQPETGEQCLFVDPYHTARVEGLPQEESRALLSDLFAHFYRPQNVYEHAWRLGDLVIWNNHAVQHSRGPALRSQVGNRTLRRVEIGLKSIEEQFPGYIAEYNPPTDSQAKPKEMSQ